MHPATMKIDFGPLLCRVCVNTVSGFPERQKGRCNNVRRSASVRRGRNPCREVAQRPPCFGASPCDRAPQLTGRAILRSARPHVGIGRPSIMRQKFLCALQLIRSLFICQRLLPEQSLRPKRRFLRRRAQVVRVSLLWAALTRTSASQYRRPWEDVGCCWSLNTKNKGSSRKSR